MPQTTQSTFRDLVLLSGGVAASLLLAASFGLLVAALGGGFDEASLGRVMAQPWVLAGMAGVQYAGMTAVAIVLCVVARRPVASALAIVRPSRRHAAAGVAAGVVTVFVASGVAGLLLEAFPGLDVAALEQLGEVFRVGPLGPRIALAVAVSVAAPVGEELVFRGALWDTLSRRMRPGWVFVITSLVFAAWHRQAFHVATLVPTAFLFGWLRWRTGSVIPSLLAHGVNNTVGAVLLLTAGDASVESEFQVVPFLLGLVGYAVVVGGLRAAPAEAATPAP